MHTQREIMEMAIAKAQLKSLNGLSYRLQSDRANLAACRNGRRKLGRSEAVEIAHLAQLPPGYVLACTEAEFEKKPAVADAWKEVAETMSKGLAACLLLGMLAMIDAGSGEVDDQDVQNARLSEIYIMRNT